MDNVYFFEALFVDGSGYMFVYDDFSEPDCYYWNLALRESLSIAEERGGLKALCMRTY